MSKKFLWSLPILVSLSPHAVAQPIDSESTYSQEVIAVSELSDVSSKDWAFSALQSLVERYQCIDRFPDRQYGQQVLSRYEFASSVNTCLNKLTETFGTNLSEKVTKDDLETLQRLQQDFARELNALKNLSENLETRSKILEAQQFSTTTKLSGSVLFTPIRVFSDNPSTTNAQNVVLGTRVGLTFDTSFTGRDLLRLRLQSNSIPNLATTTGTLTTRLSLDVGDDNFRLDDLWYRFPVDNAMIYVGANGLNIFRIFDVLNPNLESANIGSLSRFSRFDPLIFRGQDGTGVGASIEFSDSFTLTASYLANNSGGAAANPTNGLFGGGNSITTQLVFTPQQNLNIGLAYQRGFDPGRQDITSGTGTDLANNPFGNGAAGATSDRYGIQLAYNPTPDINLAGSISFANVQEVNGLGNVELGTWMASLTIRNLFGIGNQGSVIVGQPPRILSTNNVGSNSSRRICSLKNGGQNPFHLEALYRIRLSRNISVTPGAIVIFNPGTGDASSPNNQPIFLGLIRTNFFF